MRCFRLGLVGYCRPGSGIEGIHYTIAAVARDGASLPRDLLAGLVRSLGVDDPAAGPINARAPLTEREWEVLLQVWQRRRTADIATSLYVSAGTIRSHIHAILHKLDVGSRDEAIDAFDDWLAG